MNIIPSAYHVRMKPIDYARQLARMLERNPDMDIKELATRIDKTEDFINRHLNLLK